MYRATLTRVISNLRMGVRSPMRSMSESGESGPKNEKVVLPPEPTTCCNSGCPNCVWIKYAQELAQMYDNGDVIARQKISENVKDPNLKAFLFTALGLEETVSKRT